MGSLLQLTEKSLHYRIKESNCTCLDLQKLLTFVSSFKVSSILISFLAPSVLSAPLVSSQRSLFEEDYTLRQQPWKGRVRLHTHHRHTHKWGVRHQIYWLRKTKVIQVFDLGIGEWCWHQRVGTSIILCKHRGDLQLKVLQAFEFSSLLHIKSLIFLFLGYVSNVLIMYFRCLRLTMTFYCAMKSKLVFELPSWVEMNS